MNTRQLLQFESIIACQAMLNNKEFRGQELETLREKFDRATAEVHTLWHTQNVEHGTSSADAGQLTRMRKELRQRLLRITRRAVVVLDGMPGIRQDLRVPHANVKVAELLTAGTRIVKNLRPHLRTLHEEGLPTNTVPGLVAAMKAIKEKSGSPDAAIARRSRATASLPDAIRRARDIAKAIDSIVRADLDGNAIATWENAYRIPRKKGRPKKKRRPPPS
jgi:hypothetical protein